jgi:translation initiation factor IF-3
VAPLKNKSEAKAEQNAVRTANKQAAREAKSGTGAASAEPTDETAA